MYNRGGLVPKKRPHQQLCVANWLRVGSSSDGEHGGTHGEQRTRLGEFKWAFSKGEVTTSDSLGLPEFTGTTEPVLEQKGVVAGPGHRAKSKAFSLVQ